MLLLWHLLIKLPVLLLLRFGVIAGMLIVTVEVPLGEMVMVVVDIKPSWGPSVAESGVEEEVVVVVVVVVVVEVLFGSVGLFSVIRLVFVLLTDPLKRFNLF